MSSSTLIIGQSGTGKSSSLRNLDSKSTFILNVLDKPLPFRGYKNRYNTELKNYHATDDWVKLCEYIQAVDKRRPEIKTLIIDDFQYLLANEFMRRATERGFDKFTDIAQHAWMVVKTLTSTRPDLHCFVLSHSDADPQGKVKCKTIGKMLDDKITLEGMFTVCFHSMIVDGEYKFMTQSDGIHIAKSPLGMFEDKFIDNDLNEIIPIMQHYFDEDDLL